MSGLVIFNYFGECTNNSLTAVIGNSALINKVYIPKYIFPIAKCLFVGINFLFSLIPLLLIILISGDAVEGTKCYINIYYLLLPFIYLCMLMFTIGICYILSTVCVFVRDLIYIWGICLTILNYFTPIFYDLSILPETLQTIFKFNPLYVYINATREIMLYGNAPTFTYLLTAFLSGFIIMIIGMFIFKKKQDKFIYYL